MEQEATQELICVQSHEPLPVAMGGIAPAESDVALCESDQSGVGDGDAMGVGAEIAQHMFRSAEERLGVNDPVVAEQYSQPCAEGVWLGKRQQAAVELEFTSMESVAKSGDELAAEDAVVYENRKKEQFDNRSWFEPAVKEARIPRLTWHTLRHTFCSWPAMAGATTREIMEAAGHKTVSQAARYSHLPPQHTQSVVDRIAGTGTANSNMHQNEHRKKSNATKKSAGGRNSSR